MTNLCQWQPTTVTLYDGQQVLSNSEEWRHECEARYILNMDTKTERIEQLKRIEKHRGTAERDRLEKTILQLWSARRASDAKAVA